MLETRSFDGQQLLEQVGGDWDLLSDLVEMLREDSQSCMNAIQQAIRSGDATRLEESSHELKGAVGNFTKGRCFQAAAKLERRAREGRLESLDALAEEVEGQLRQLLPELNDFLEERNL